jgi:hypothetical protein
MVCVRVPARAIYKSSQLVNRCWFFRIISVDKPQLHLSRCKRAMIRRIPEHAAAPPTGIVCFWPSPNSVDAYLSSVLFLMSFSFSFSILSSNTQTQTQDTRHRQRHRHAHTYLSFPDIASTLRDMMFLPPTPPSPPNTERPVLSET